MITVLLAVILFGVACVVVGLTVQGMRALAVSGGAVLVFVASCLVWLLLLGLGVVGVVGVDGPVGRALSSGLEGPWILLPPLLPTAAFVFFFVFLARQA